MPAFCRRLPSPRYIWTFPLCTPFPILYQSQASLLNEFKIAGLDALRSHKKGRKKTLSQSKTQKIEKQVHQPMVDVSVEHVQELEDENLKLRIENAFLKETRRLRLEDEAKMRELRKSSPVSEEHSN